MKVAVTGSGRPFAQALLPLLLGNERIDHIVGIDRDETPFRHDRFTQVLLDTRSPQIGRVLTGIDAVVHLAAVGIGEEELTDREARRDVYVNGGQNVFRCAAQAGVGCAIHLSTAAVYALPARRLPIDEGQPRVALSGFAWAEDQVALEAWLDAYAQEHRGLRLVRLRPHLMVGAHGSAFARRLLRAPFAIRFTGHTPRLQCVHALDVAAAVQQALFSDAAGSFNLACANAATLREMQRYTGGGALALPFPLAYRLLRLAWRRRAADEPAWAESLRYELVLDTTAARRKLGWKPQYDSVQTCLQAAG